MQRATCCAHSIRFSTASTGSAPALICLALALLCILLALSSGRVRAQAQDESDAAVFLPIAARDDGFFTRAISVAAGHNFTCALTASGAAWCWGDNEHGQLGDGSRNSSQRPVRVRDLPGDVASLTAGDWGHVCALTRGGGVLCWGFNGHGQLGDNTLKDRLTPVQVVDLTSGVGALTAGHGHTCALTTAGAALCWGHNDTYQLGNGSRKKRPYPGLVLDLTSDVRAIGAGFWHTSAITGDGIRGWGSNEHGELGNGSRGKGHTPVAAVDLPAEFVAITGGVHFTCGLTRNASVYCWGLNDYGQLGDGTLTTRLRAVAVRRLTEPVAAIVAGDAHTCALTGSGGVLCWGRNDFGQLGDGTTISRPSPAPVLGLQSGVRALAAGWGHTCALLRTGNVLCWGSNALGQLGEGSTVDRLTPAAVRSGG